MCYSVGCSSTTGIPVVHIARSGDMVKDVPLGYGYYPASASG